MVDRSATIPAAAARRLALVHYELNLERVIIFAMGNTHIDDDSATFHVTTWGRSHEDKHFAAEFGDEIRRALGAGPPTEDFRSSCPENCRKETS